MSTTHNRCAHICSVWPALVTLSAVTVMGCQTPGNRRAPVYTEAPADHATQTYADQNSDTTLLSPSPSDVFAFADQAIPAEDVAAHLFDPPVLSETEARDLFNNIRGKLGTNNDGAIVEADLSFSDVSDKQLASLEAFTEIRELDLTGTHVNDNSLSVLTKLQKLQALKLKGTRISSAGMLSIAQISTLVLLDASNTDVSDDGLSLASQWTSLRYLSLNNTTVSDAAVPYLKSVATLRGLSLLNTNVTPDGIRTLKNALPDCLIVTEVESEISPSSSNVPLLPIPAPDDAAFAVSTAADGIQLDKLVQLAHQYPEIAGHLASIYSAREQWAEAAQILSAAADTDSEDQTTQFLLGTALARSGNMEAGKMHLAQAVGEAAASYNLGIIEYENNLRNCAQLFHQALAADPSLTDAQTRLQEVQRELADLKRQRMRVLTVSSSSTFLEDAPMEVIPAPSVQSASHSNSLPDSAN